MGDLDGLIICTGFFDDPAEAVSEGDLGDAVGAAGGVRVVGPDDDVFRGYLQVAPKRLFEAVDPRLIEFHEVQNDQQDLLLAVSEHQRSGSEPAGLGGWAVMAAAILEAYEIRHIDCGDGGLNGAGQPYRAGGFHGFLNRDK